MRQNEVAGDSIMLQKQGSKWIFQIVSTGKLLIGMYKKQVISNFV